MKYLQTILCDVYGVGAVSAPWVAVTWAVSLLESQKGAEVAAREMKALNRARSKAGVYTSIPEVGTDLFRAYFAK